MGLAHFLSTEHLVTNFCNFFVIQHQMEVALKSQRRPLSRGVMSRLPWLRLNSYSLHYRTTFAFSIIPYSQPRQFTLRFAFPVFRGGYELTTFRLHTIRWVRCCLSAGGTTSVSGKKKVPEPAHLPFGSSLSAPLACQLSRRLSTVHICSPYHLS